MVSPFGPLTLGGWRYVRRPHSTPLTSRTRSLAVNPDGSRADGSSPNTVYDVGGRALYVEHYLWKDIDLKPFLHPDDAGREILYVALAIKLIISDSGYQDGVYRDRMTTIAVKVIPPDEPAEAGITDFQQPLETPDGTPIHWTENVAQMVCRTPDSPRQWQTCIVAAVGNTIRWGGMFRPAAPADSLGMAFSIFLEGYCLRGAA